MENTLWIVGLLIMQGDTELGWMAEGLFNTEPEAAAAAQDNEFIICVKVGERFPEQAADAIKLYFPKKERWEDSKLYKMRTGAIDG